MFWRGRGLATACLFLSWSGETDKTYLCASSLISPPAYVVLFEQNTRMETKTRLCEKSTLHTNKRVTRKRYWWLLNLIPPHYTIDITSTNYIVHRFSVWCAPIRNPGLDLFCHFPSVVPHLCCCYRRLLLLYYRVRAPAYPGILKRRHRYRRHPI